MAPRFECVLDPCDLYEVWDNETDLPVVIEGRLLAFASRSRAEWTAGLLNAEAVGPSPGEHRPAGRLCGIARTVPCRTTASP